MTEEIRKAATVLLVRDSCESVEVFMMKRPRGGDFPDLHVFPGGKVDPQDDVLSSACVDLDDSNASLKMNLDQGALRYWVAAIRECFEEAGVLLAYRDGSLFSYRDASEERRFSHYRDALINGELTMGAFVQAEKLELATDRVRYFSHWITPEWAPVRFDVRFFVASMPEGQAADGHAVEMVSGEWVRPATAISRQMSGSWRMIDPTITSLKMIESFHGVEVLCNSVEARCHLPEITEDLHFKGMQYDS